MSLVSCRFRFPKAPPTFSFSPPLPATSACNLDSTHHFRLLSISVSLCCHCSLAVEKFVSDFLTNFPRMVALELDPLDG